MDNVSPEKRSEIMSKVRSKNTGLEMTVRKLIWKLGYRYRIHQKDLPGKPDLVFPGRRKVIFINGCFWHRHDCPAGRQIPKTRKEFWEKKLSRNIERDKVDKSKLLEKGWESMVIWQCEIKKIEELTERIHNFLRT